MADGDVHQAHFESLARQADTARFGMWVFVASEALLFGALFALYAAYRVHWPVAFAQGVSENAAILGTTNTTILLGSSFLVAAATERMSKGHRGATIGLLAGAIVVGALFLVIKGYEYAGHFAAGVHPGGRGPYFERAPPGTAVFFTLYFAMTGLHGIHVIVGMGVLAVAAFRVHTRTFSPHALEVAALYWHLVDCVWIFLWPLFYLTRS